MLAGRYTLRRLLGRGGMGEVWEAHDAVLQRSVAVKLIRLSQGCDAQVTGQRFIREAQASAAISHPNVVTIHDFGTENSVAFMVMERLPGPDLATLVKREGPLPVEQAARYLEEVASGLAAAHAEGVLHRDIKPSNVMLTKSGSAKVLDFGIAALADDAEHLTGTANVIGTFAYLAPERIMGAPATPRTDLYALGCLGTVLLSGRPPFEGTSGQLVYKHLNEAPPALSAARPDAPAALLTLLADLLAKNPAARPESAAAVVARLREIQATTARPNPDHSSTSTILGVTLPRPSAVDSVPHGATVLRPPVAASMPAAPGGSPRRGSGRLLGIIGGSAAALVLMAGMAVAVPRFAASASFLTAPTTQDLAQEATQSPASQATAPIPTTEAPSAIAPPTTTLESSTTTQDPDDGTVTPLDTSSTTSTTAKRPVIPPKAPPKSTTTTQATTTTTVTTTTKATTTTTTTKATTTAAPQRRVTVTKGAIANQPTCPTCAWVVVRTANFSGNVTCTLYWPTAAGSWVQGPNAVLRTKYWYGVKGRTVKVTCGGVTGSLVWP